VNAVMNLAFHKMRGISWLAENLSDFQEGLLHIVLLVDACLRAWVRARARRTLYQVWKYFVFQNCRVFSYDAS
jgi:hypothetical protein